MLAGLVEEGEVAHEELGGRGKKRWALLNKKAGGVSLLHCLNELPTKGRNPQWKV